MRGNKRVISLLLICWLGWAALLSNQTHGSDFSTNFESTNTKTIEDFTVTNNGLSVLFSGGTSFTIGNGLLYHSGSKSWMIDPAGSSSRGTSTGTGTLTFSEGAMALDFFIRTSNSGSSGQVQIIDSTGAIIADITTAISNNSWLHVEKTLMEGDALMTAVRVSAFGSDMLAVDDLSFSSALADTEEAVDDEEEAVHEEELETQASAANELKSSGGTLYWLSLLMLALLGWRAAPATESA
ncbi:MAG: hypothetical protein RPR40_11640 [Bermanella sp.]